MNAQRCLEILREIKDVAFATVDEKGLPQIRIIDVMIVENEKLYFCTARGKDFHRQLTENGQVAITGMNREFQMIRLSGKAEKLEEHKYWMDKGKIEQFAKPKELLCRPATEFVRELVKRERRTCYLPEGRLASCEFSGAVGERESHEAN